MSAGTGPLTGKRLYLKATATTAAAARLTLARPPERAAAGREPEPDATATVLLERYMAVAELGLSTRESCDGCIRRTIVPALGKMELRTLRGPVLGTCYARLRRCSDVGCTGRPSVEHRNVPVLTVDPRDRRPGWRHLPTRSRRRSPRGTRRRVSSSRRCAISPPVRACGR